MSLNYDWSKCKELKELHAENPSEAATTDAIVFRTLTVGINKITETNAEDFLERCRAADKVYGHTLTNGTTGEGVSLTWEDIRRRIGLSTNAAKLTYNQFVKKLGEAVMREARRQILTNNNWKRRSDSCLRLFALYHTEVKT